MESFTTAHTSAPDHSPSDPLEPAHDLCAFVNASPSPFHAVAEAARRLEADGFTALSEGDEWHLMPGDAHYVTRADASLIAFRVGSQHPIHAGFQIIGAHTDSPNLRLKPQPFFAKEGVVQLGVEVYGGVLLHTWIDRDLGLAGRVIVQGSDGQLLRRRVRIHEPLCRVTSLAIHLDRDVNDKGAIYNRQQHLAPLLALGDSDQVRARLLQRLAEQCDTTPEHILGFDLGLYDLTPASVGGYDHDFVYAARLDNLASCHAAVRALCGGPQVTEATRVIALFDHEEIGSSSAQGAAGSFLKDVLLRTIEATGEVMPTGGLSRAISKSFCISADMAHAVHPNYSDKHEPRHMPHLGKGPVVKSNVQQRYATDGLSAAQFRSLCHRAGVPFQDFVTRTDLACGSTIGPITSTQLGIATVDVGNPMLSMHSSRELCGAKDVGKMIQVMKQLFQGP